MLIALGALGLVAVGIAAGVAQRVLESKRLERERLTAYHESEEYLQQAAAEKLAWEELMVRRRQLRLGLSYAEVVAIMGTEGAENSEATIGDSEVPYHIRYELERRVLDEAFVLIWIEYHGVRSIDTAPGFALPFVSSDWIVFGPDYRGAMAEDLVESELLIGRTREEVLALLGEPTDPYITTRREVSYWLGNQMSGPGGYTLLRVKSDASGLVTKAYIYNSD